jgi:hypothetical protein
VTCQRWLAGINQDAQKLSSNRLVGRIAVSYLKSMLIELQLTQLFVAIVSTRDLCRTSSPPSTWSKSQLKKPPPKAKLRQI